MIIPSILSQKYWDYERIVSRMAEEARRTLLNYCDKHGYAFVSRVKTIESLAEKIETGRYQKWSDLDDLFACTIIVPTLSQEETVSAFCESVFSIKEIKKRGHAEKAPDVFRFESTRIYAQLYKPHGTEIVESPSIYDILFEIQIRTAFEHAWSVSTHDLVYKAPDVDWKRLRLAAQVKATVEQLDILILAFEKTLEHVAENKWPEINEKRKISQKIEQFRDDGFIPKECLPKDLSRFCDNLYKLIAKKDKITLALEAIEMEISRLPNDMFPRSISLLQYFLVILIKKGDIAIKNRDYYHNIPEDALQIYPELHTIKSRFDYNA